MASTAIAPPSRRRAPRVWWLRTWPARVSTSGSQRGPWRVFNIRLAKLTFLNAEGHKNSFGADDDAFSRSEGAGALVLKRLGKALAERDSFRAVIQTTGTNSDGWTECVTMPSDE
ncbi:Reducing polyketide synthase FUB1 [Colletotrichum gloeosporioides]|uniref:Reducing polyketide synthase FUB1 n=1 Tax=Colletotrichum gloeosporioides TaxID=474922 RepID=A0A8H4CL60_COLGL|nr:Reducing polyketide synthase FUB1 [Colletotrichum gloeosporioides]KAF3805841.1 Reducing polyketide synthase FUB1 [Colletotrichum gloeosporioides]